MASIISNNNTESSTTSTIIENAIQKKKKSNNKRKQLLLKYIIFKSLGPDKYWFSKINSNYLFERYAVAFQNVLGKREDAINMIFRKKPNTINILDVGSGAGILSIFAARTCCTKNKPQFNLKQRLNVVKVEGMKPVAAAVRRFFALHSMEFENDNDSDEDNSNNNNDDVPTTMFTVESYLSDREMDKDSKADNHHQKKNIIIIDPFSTILTSSTPVVGGFGNGFLSCLEDLKNYGNISPDNSIFFPAKAKLHMQLLYIRNQPSVPPMTFCLNEPVEGFDLSFFNVFRGGMEEEGQRTSQRLDYTHMKSIDYKVISLPTCFKVFDMKELIFSPNKLNAELKAHYVQVEIPIIESGCANAIMYWYSIDLGDGSPEISYHPAVMNDKIPLCRQGIHLFHDKNKIYVKDKVCNLTIKIDFEEKYPFVVTNDNNNNNQFAVTNDLTLYKQLNSKDISGVSRWHFSMLCDHERNLAYEMALRKVLQHRSNATVLDIGTGTGLLAMMAARCGAKKVIGCELNPAVALVAENIVKQNHFNNIVEIVSKKSNDLQIVSDEEKFDLCVSEILDCGLLGENVLPTVQDARKRLLKDDAVVIPHSAKVYGILIHIDVNQGAPISILPSSKKPTKKQNDNNNNNNKLRTHVFKPFTRGTSRYEQIRLNDLKHVKLSKPIEIFNMIDLASGTEPNEKEMYPYVDSIIENGYANAIALYFDVYLDSEKQIVLTTSPTNTSTCWGQAIQIFDKEIECKQNEPIVLHAKHDFTSIKVRLAEDLDFDI